MKIFLFSRRFLIPFFIAIIIHTGYLVYEVWQLYKDDFAGKGLPSSLKYEWLFSQGAILFPFSFLLSFAIGITYYSHYRFKKSRDVRKLFSPVNLVVVAVIAVAGFIYNSFYVPDLRYKSTMLLADIVFYTPGNNKQPFIRSTDKMHRTAYMLRMPELYKLRDSLASEAVGKKDEYHYSFDKGASSPLQKARYEIAKRTAWPFVSIVFYLLCTLLGISFCRTHVVFPVLIAWIALFTVWYYGQRFLEIKYKMGSMGLFLSVNGLTILLTLLALLWIFFLKKYNFFGKNTVADS